MSETLWRTKFEIFGQVQGVYFRKYTKSKANQLGIRGYIRNTRNGSVEGVMEGQETSYKEMKKWLAKVGSPKCLIQGAVWRGERKSQQYSYADVTIRKR